MALMQASELHQFCKDVVPRIAKDGPSAFQHLSKSPEELLECLLRSCEEPHLTARYKAAAYRALAGFLDQGAASSPDLKSFCVGRGVFETCLNVYLSRYESHSAKPMRQLLVTLVRILGLLDGETRFARTSNAVKKCLLLVLDREDPSGVKPAMLILEMLLNKERLLAKDIILVMRDLKVETDQAGGSLQSVNTGELLPIAQLFVQTVLEWTNMGHVSQIACSLLFTFCRSFKSSSCKSMVTSIPLWLGPLRQLLERDQSYVEMLERNVLPELLRSDAAEVLEELSTVLEQLRKNHFAHLTETDIRFCILVLKCGRESFKSQDNNSFIGTTLRATKLTEQPLVEINLLSHPSFNIRLAALDLLASAYQLPFHIPPMVLSHVIGQAPIFHADTDAQARNLFASIMKKIFARVQISVSRLRKDLSIGLNEFDQNLTSRGLALKHMHNALNGHLNFISQYFDLLLADLRPSCSYQRHITALKVLKHLYAAGLQESRENLRVIQALLPLTMDAFDDVRAASLALIKFVIDVLPEKVPTKDGYSTEELEILVTGTVRHSRDMLHASGRADFADGFGRLQELDFGIAQSHAIRLDRLVMELKNGLTIAQTSLNQAVANAPIHGNLIALRYILGRPDLATVFSQANSSWVEFHNTLMSLLNEVWEVVRPILCVDSPEGQSFFEEEGEADIGIKDTLSYSWRALKETSSLMQVIVSNEGYARCSPTQSLSLEDLQTVGRLSFIQLATLRHRGAFSTVAHAFAACCAACRRSTELSIQQLPGIWYKETLSCIHERANALTRRSAGLPSMMTGVLVSSDGQFIKSALEQLQDIARQHIEWRREELTPYLPQVHALNCLKDICTNPKLGPVTEPHLADILMLTTDCLESNIWAIRNCGIMLFKSILNRLTSGSGSEATSLIDRHRRYAKATYERFPVLSELLIRLLEKSIQRSEEGEPEQSRELGFPAIQLIDRLGVLPKNRTVVSNILSGHLHSPIWIVRENAARALSSLIVPEHAIHAVQDILEHGPLGNNCLHGHLLCLKFVLLERRPNWQANEMQTLSDLLDCSRMLLHPQMSPSVTVAYLQCLELFFRDYGSVFEHENANIEANNNRDDLAELKSIIITQGKYLDIQLAQVRDNLAEPTLLECVATIRPALHPIIQVLRDDKYSPPDPLPPVKDELVLQPNSRADSSPFGINKASTLTECLNDVSTKAAKQQHQQLERSLLYLTEALGNHDKGEASMFSDPVSVELLAVLRRLEQTIPQNDSVAALLLSARGSLLTKVCLEGEECRVGAPVSAERWSRDLHAALAERSDLSLRLAAVKSMGCFRDIIGHNFQNTRVHKATLLTLATALVTALVDDDDEVRDEAATILSYVVSEPAIERTYQLHHVAARTVLNKVLGEAFASLPEILVVGTGYILGLPVWAAWPRILVGEQDRQESIRDDENFSESGVLPPGSSRTDVQLTSLLCCTSAADLLERALNQDKSLFDVERPNLFVDEVQEAEAWVNILISADENNLRLSFVEQLRSWVLEGLEALVKYIQQHYDGPLGWSNQREVFVLGMRLLLLAQLLLGWKVRGYDVTAVEHSLGQLLEDGGKSGLNVHWLKKIRQISKLDE